MTVTASSKPPTPITTFTVTVNPVLFSVNYFGLLATIILAGSGATWTGVESMVMA